LTESLEYTLTLSIDGAQHPQVDGQFD
jgi:hypothetical protein